MTSPSMSSVSPPPARYTATVPFYLGAVFLVLISFPGLDFAGGITVALAAMFLCFPIWFHAARLRAGPIFDPAARAGIAVILSCVVFLIAWAFLSAIGTDIPFRAGRIIASLAGAIAVYLLVLGTITEPRMDTYLRITCITLALTCLVSFIALAEPTLHTAIFRNSDRARGFFKNPNQLGIAISTLLPVALSCLIARPGHRLFWGICVALFALGLVLSGSKANLLLSTLTTGVIILSASYILHTGYRRGAMILLGLVTYIILVALGFVLLSVLNPRAVRILTRFFTPDAEVQSLEARGRLWEYSINAFMADPFFGEGAGQPLNLIETGRQVAHSHNIILDSLRTVGLPGLFAILILAATVIALSLGAMRMAFGSRSGRPDARVVTIGLAVGSVTYLAANFSSDSMGPSTSPFLWVALFLCLASRARLSLPTDRHEPRSP